MLCHMPGACRSVPSLGRAVNQSPQKILYSQRSKGFLWRAFVPDDVEIDSAGAKRLCTQNLELSVGAESSTESFISDPKNTDKLIQKKQSSSSLQTCMDSGFKNHLHSGLQWLLGILCPEIRTMIVWCVGVNPQPRLLQCVFVYREQIQESKKISSRCLFRSSKNDLHLTTRMCSVPKSCHNN